MKQNQKVMLVEDDNILRPLIAGFLADYDILPVANGQQALDLIKEVSDIDLVLCDYHMPGWNGVETIKRLHAVSPHTRFILMSGSEPNELSTLALEAKADAWLNKPFIEEILVEQIKSLLKADSHIPQRVTVLT